MKKRVLTILIMVFALGFSAFAQNAKTEEFKVYGNCGSCKARIEKAAKSVEGVTTADWNKETKLIKVTYDPVKTDIHKINMAIAMAGHDTDMHKAPQEAYDKLPACCKYDREESKAQAGKKKDGGH
jgi:mercuric ion binding protein